MTSNFTTKQQHEYYCLQRMKQLDQACDAINLPAFQKFPMAKDPVNNLNVLSQDLLPTPQQVKAALPLTDKAQATVLQGRGTGGGGCGAFWTARTRACSWSSGPARSTTSRQRKNTPSG